MMTHAVIHKGFPIITSLKARLTEESLVFSQNDNLSFKKDS